MEFEPKLWQKAVIEEVNKLNECVDSEKYISMSDYDRNRDLKIRVEMPSGSGHTTLAAYLLSSTSSTIVFGDPDHWKEIEDVCRGFDFNIYSVKTRAISFYEISYAIQYSTGNTVAKEMKSIKNRLQPTELVIVDRASEIPKIICDFIMQEAPGKVLFLG